MSVNILIHFLELKTRVPYDWLSLHVFCYFKHLLLHQYFVVRLWSEMILHKTFQLQYLLKHLQVFILLVIFVIVLTGILSLQSITVEAPFKLACLESVSICARVLSYRLTQSFIQAMAAVNLVSQGILYTSNRLEYL